MHDFFLNHPTIAFLYSFLLTIFSRETAPTQRQLIAFVLAIYALNTCRSVRFMFNHFISDFLQKKLKSIYYTFADSPIDLDRWTVQLIEKALTLIPEECDLPILLVIDDTLAEKSGNHFEAVGTLHDHAAHNGTNYLHGHCFVCLVLMIPVECGNGYRYIRFPVAYRMWTPNEEKQTEKSCTKVRRENKKAAKAREFKTKLRIARELLESAATTIGNERQMIVMGDSWYPKADVLEFIKKHKNVEAIFNVPINTALYDKAPGRTGRRGRPAKTGKQLNVNNDFEFTDVPGTDYSVAHRMVSTNLFGRGTMTMAYVTETKTTKSRRLFICTNPGKCSLALSMISDETAKATGRHVPAVQCFCTYTLRWGIEVGFLEQKAYWGFSDYMLRSVTGIERLVNLQSISYAVLSMLPWADPTYEYLRGYSVQERRYEIGRLIDQQMFFAQLAKCLEGEENQPELAKICATIARKEFRLGKTGS